MRLDFNVLWVDDQPSRVEAQIRAITKQMEDEGFQFNSTPCISIADVLRLVGTHVFIDEIDLVLVDWDLGSGIHGEDAIVIIRQAVPYKDVVFYSARSDSETLRRLAFDKGIEGVYCASREELVDEVLGVFESLVKKVLDLDHTRGIVMGATSDIDYMINECLIAAHGRLNDAGKEAMLREMHRRIEEKIKDLAKQAAKIQKDTRIASVLQAHMLFTANDRLRMLSHVLKDQLFKAHADARTSVAKYMEKVLPERNNLGHLVLIPEGKPRAIANAEGKQVSLEEARELRRVILALRNDFRNLLFALRGDKGATSSGAAPTRAE